MPVGEEHLPVTVEATVALSGYWLPLPCLEAVYGSCRWMQMLCFLHLSKEEMYHEEGDLTLKAEALQQAVMDKAEALQQAQAVMDN